MSEWRDLALRPCGWLASPAPQEHVVLSSRIRLARNLTGQRFPQRAAPAERAGLLQEVLDKTREVALLDGGPRFVLERLERVQRQLLGERQLVSQDLVETPEGRGVVVAADQTASFMINEEDHLRVQAFRSGLDLDGAYRSADALERDLDGRLEFAWSERFGFLTACPTNAGTGMRASVLLHLPGVVMHKEFDALVEDLRGRQLTLRGFHGEGTAAVGYFFQVSNATTLGIREADILERLDQAARDLVAWEERARTALLSRARTLLEDKIWRSYGVLRYARVLASREALIHASLLRLGTSLGVLQLPVQALNEILIHSQPAHAELLGCAEGPAETDAWRAEMVRKKLRQSEP